MKIVTVSRNSERRDFITSIASFYAQELNLKNSKFELEIYSVKNLRRDDEMNGVVSHFAPRKLKMLIDSRLSHRKLFETLAHEMIHVKQFARGQIKFYTSRNGKRFSTWLGKRYKNTDYYDLPWEIEAFSKERLLANKLEKILKVD
jgi:hypothetical protein